MDTTLDFVKVLSVSNSTMLAALLLTGALWEFLCPARAPAHFIGSRWVGNAALDCFNALISTWLTPCIGAGFALIVTTYSVGLFHKISLDVTFIWIVSIVLLDLKQYLFHRLVHHVEWMWKFHRVHHSDLDCDVTTGLRHHPFEAVFALILHCALVGLLGIPISVLLFYGVLVYAENFFTHSNIYINAKWDLFLRFLLVTPNMHRIHHSENFAEGNTNFGALFTLWDRLFGTYQEKPLLGQDQMVFGLSEFRDISSLGLRHLLSMPFAKSVSKTVSHPMSPPDDTPVQPHRG